MVILGVDAHKRSHTFVAVDEVGRKLAERTFPATHDGHREQTSPFDGCHRLALTLAGKLGWGPS